MVTIPNFSTPDCNTCAVSYSFNNYFSCCVHRMTYMYSTVLYGMFHILFAHPPLRMMGFRTTVQGDSDTFLKESDKILTSQKNFLKVPTMNKPFRFNFSKNTDKNLRFQIPIIFRLGDKKWNVSIRTTLFNLLMTIIHWNFDQTKGQGTGKMCSLWQGFVKSSFFFIFLVCNHVTRHPCCGSIQYKFFLEEFTRK